MGVCPWVRWGVVWGVGAEFGVGAHAPFYISKKRVSTALVIRIWVGEKVLFFFCGVVGGGGARVKCWIWMCACWK